MGDRGKTCAIRPMRRLPRVRILVPRVPMEGVAVSNEEGPAPAREDRIKRVAERLRELEALGVPLWELLNGPAGKEFVSRECQGDPELAGEAFAFVHSPKLRGERQALRRPYG